MNISEQPRRSIITSGGSEDPLQSRPVLPLLPLGESPPATTSIASSAKRIGVACMNCRKLKRKVNSFQREWWSIINLLFSALEDHLLAKDVE